MSRATPALRTSGDSIVWASAADRAVISCTPRIARGAAASLQ
jgi:hypothetical protein